MKTLRALLLFLALSCFTAAAEKIRYTHNGSVLNLFYHPPLPTHYYVWEVVNLADGFSEFRSPALNDLGDMTLSLEMNQFPGQRIRVWDFGEVVWLAWMPKVLYGLE